MPSTPIWPGSSSFTIGSTPFGFYDNDYDFQRDADKVAKFCAQRLGYPLVDVELQSLNFYTAFEDAITTYGNETYAFKVRENYLSLEGATNVKPLNNTATTPNMGVVIRQSDQYGVEAGAGGNVTYRTGSIHLIEGQQNYDLNAWALSQSIEMGDLEIKKIFYEEQPAIVRYFDPYAGTGTDIQALMDTFDFGNYSPGINFMLMPINYDLQKIQAIEFNDQVRKSNFSFELVNNQLRIFPIPQGYRRHLFFHYILKSDRVAASLVTGSNIITDTSNVPYTNPQYKLINSVGRQWIYEYTLALCKEMLGYVRGKYGPIPIPGAEVTLNQSDLLSAATAEKNALIERLRAYLDETSRKSLLERRKDEAEFRRTELGNVPFTIYIG
jgi:hypothetical protein